MLNDYDFRNIDRRIIYLLVLITISLPILTGFSVIPARLKSSEKFFSIMEEVDQSKPHLAIVSLDFGPGTQAENEPEAKVIVEHLLRRRVKFAVLSTVPIAGPFLTNVPEQVVKRLQQEQASERWEYGKDWVNVGYKPGGDLFVQSLARSDDLAKFFGKDVFGNILSDLPIFHKVVGFKDIPFLAEFTGLQGVFPSYIQFFQRKDYVPKFGHGCTSIMIPEAYIYLDSGQLTGLLEGVSGAAWYSELLRKQNPARKADEALIMNTALGVAQIVIIALVVVGNLAFLFQKKRLQ